MAQHFKDLIVWQKAMDLIVDVYQITDGFPKREIYSLTDQIHRAAVSVPSNIAEGQATTVRLSFCTSFIIQAVPPQNSRLDCYWQKDCATVITIRHGFSSDSYLRLANSLMA